MIDFVHAAVDLGQWFHYMCLLMGVSGRIRVVLLILRFCSVMIPEQVERGVLCASLNEKHVPTPAQQPSCLWIYIKVLFCRNLAFGNTPAAGPQTATRQNLGRPHPHGTSMISRQSGCAGFCGSHSSVHSVEPRKPKATRCVLGQLSTLS